MAKVVVAHKPDSDMSKSDSHLIQIEFTDCEVKNLLAGLIINQTGDGVGELRIKMEGCCADKTPDYATRPLSSPSRT